MATVTSQNGYTNTELSHFYAKHKDTRFMSLLSEFSVTCNLIRILTPNKSSTTQYLSGTHCRGTGTTNNFPFKGRRNSGLQLEVD